jgi:hypothetical protein
MLHAFAPLWKRNSEFNVTPLPQHYLDNQIAAIRGRFQLGPNDPIPDCAIYLLICRVCENVYSLYNEYGEGKSCMNPRTCDGYRSADCVAHCVGHSLTLFLAATCTAT